MDDLALQISEVDDVEVNQPERSHARRGKVQSQRRTESTSADAEHTRCLELLLTIKPDFGHDEVPRIPQDLVFSERIGCESGSGHTSSLRRSERLFESGDWAIG